jgi:lipopolysaccharide/colanic/teichoic acid biosynthesis glycosyltransferase
MDVKVRIRKDRPQLIRPASHGNPAAHPPAVGRRYLRFKTALDFILALLLLALSAPVLLVIGLLIKLTSRGPVLYKQTRLGKHGRPFTIYKIRTMAHDCERLTGPRWSAPGDPRVTLVGRFLRKAHLDELPQLWNVLRGDMSLVGPRPERPEFLPALERALPRYRERLAVRPGLTGLAQVQLPPDTDVNGVRRKLAYDIHYIQRLGLWLDLRILLCTLCLFLHIPTHLPVWLLRLPGRRVMEQAHPPALAEV